jgi:MFS transporter, DHA1 family, multidrug resistance protein
MSRVSDRVHSESSPLARHVLVLGSLMALSAAGTDAYLPAFPNIAQGLGTGEDRVQLTLVSYFLALAVGQLLYGPVSDQVGRKKPLYAGLGLFVLASVGCAFAPSVEMLIAMRFLQGVGACAGMVLSVAAVRDLHSGVEAARMLSLMMLVLAVSPLLAPLSGSVLILFFPWTSVFWLLALLGVLCMLLVGRHLEETNPVEKRASGGVGGAFVTYAELLRDRRIVGLIVIMAAAQAGFFAYLVGAPFIFLTLHGVSPGAFSLLFGLLGMSLILCAQANARLIRAFGAPRVLVAALLVYASAGGGLLLAAMWGADRLPLTVAMLMVCVGSIGVIMPTGTVLALEPYGRIAGAASSLLGSTRFIGGVLGGLLITVFFDGTARPVASVIFAGATAAFLLARSVSREVRGETPEAEVASAG